MPTAYKPRFWDSYKHYENRCRGIIRGKRGVLCVGKWERQSAHTPCIRFINLPLSQNPPVIYIHGGGNLRAGMVLFYGSHQDLAGQDPVQIPVPYDIEILLDEGVEFAFLWAENGG